MRALLRRKLATARQVFRERGMAGVVHELAGRIRASLAPHRLRYWRDVWVYGLDNPLLGRLVELRGDRVRVGDCSFDVRSPAITTAVKSRFLFDRYERPERVAIERYIDPELPVIELGGAIGVVACLTSRRLRDPSRHVVVEANPDLLPVLERNRDSNGARFRIVHAAVAYEGPIVSFHRSHNYLGSSAHAATGVPIEVPATSVGALAGAAGFDRCSLICDIEGGELELVRHEAQLLRERVATFVVETHPPFLRPAGVSELHRTLGDAGFVQVFADADTLVFRNDALPRAGSAA